MPVSCGIPQGSILSLIITTLTMPVVLVVVLMHKLKDMDLDFSVQ